MENEASGERPPKSLRNLKREKGIEEKRPERGHFQEVLFQFLLLDPACDFVYLDIPHTATIAGSNSGMRLRNLI
jgi:hypothetical protein